ncbi:PLP-dependent aminotransferase family protein [Amphritea sp. HPY]|uniref:MocR-like ectoine utilization transcription factor EhuR n=1 Tax=Amphritea sp. HPY TaxID=3421652 RepID=UPI003D7F02DC
MKSGIPKYLAISEALEEAISSGDLQAGTRLPTHRELADQLDVSVQTVSNAYAHAEKKGIVDAWVGSGTFVSNYPIEKEAEFMLIEDKDTEGRAIDLSIAHPVCTIQHKQLFNDALIKIAHSDTDALIRAARPVQGQKHHTEAAAEWLATQKIPVETDRIVLCNGASHGLMLALGTVVQPGDLVACEELSDHGLIARSRILNFKLCGLDTDREGIIPEAFEAACKQNKIKALCCTPSMSNPTSSHMGLERRKAIADVARRYNVLVIEDDVYGALEPDRVPPLSSFLPDQAFYITALTKTVAPGLRVGFMVVPRHLLQHTISRLAASSWMATPMLFEIAAIWIKDGTLQRLIEFEQQEFAARQRLASELLAGFEYDCHPNGMHLWLHLPEGWGADELVATAQKANLLITGYQPFIVDQGQRLHRVRISLGMESSRYRIKYGLKLLAEMLSSAPPPTHFLL